MVEVAVKKYAVNYPYIDRICLQKHIAKASLGRALGFTSGWYSACRANNCKMTEEQLRTINRILRTKKAWTILVLDYEKGIEENDSVQEIKTENAPIAETIISENETSMDDLKEEIRERIMEKLPKKIHADLVEVAKKYGLEVADILALEMKFV